MTQWLTNRLRTSVQPMRKSITASIALSVQFRTHTLKPFL